MAVPTNVVTTKSPGVGSSSARSVANVIKNISPTATPFLTAIGMGTTMSRIHEFGSDSIPAGAVNAHAEGDTTAATAVTDRTVLTNPCQIFKYVISVSGSQEKAAKVGNVRSEMSYQVAKYMKRMKKDLEYAMIGVSNKKEDNSATREMGSLDAYLDATQSSLASGATAAKGDGTNVASGGAARVFTEAVFKAAAQKFYDNSEVDGSFNCVASTAYRAKISGFTGRSTARYTTNDTTHLADSVRVYESDWGDIKVEPSRQCRDGVVYFYKPDCLKTIDFRPATTKPLAETGDAMTRQLLRESTLEVSDPKGAHIIGNLKLS